MWRLLRVSILLIVLVIVGREALSERADLAWKHNFYVALYPINADGSQQVAQYIKTLSNDDFEPMEIYFAEQAKRYGISMRRPIVAQLGDQLHNKPPAPPATNANFFEIIIWSLKFRWYAWQNSPDVPIKPDIKLYCLFYDPATSNHLSHSTALNKGRIGRVNVFGHQRESKRNLVVIAHELLHTLNATDKYDLSTGLPIFPNGYAEPTKKPLYPQRYAELMGGYVPVSETQKKIPSGLGQTLIGRETAKEIGWIR